MNIKQISKSVYYVGVNDRTTRFFETLWPLPDGVSYNSYIVKGSNKIALVDGTELSHGYALLDNITSITGGKHPDYIIINHMEPDHSGALRTMRDTFPEIKFVGTRKTVEMLNGFYGINTNIYPISDGNSIDLGNINLVFKTTPMLHWPETMMTYIPEEKILFSGDAFGSFGALNGGIIDTEINIDPFIPELYRYYSNIIGKYSSFVQMALEKIKDLNIQYICSTHGPIWHNKLHQILLTYSRLSRYESDKGVVIAYGSMYGNTEELVETIAQRLTELGIKNIIIHNASYSHISYMLRDTFRYRGLIIASPTYTNGIFPPIENFLHALESRGLTNRTVGIIGSYGWGSQAAKQIKNSIGTLKLNIVRDIIESQYAPTPDIIDRCRKLAEDVAKMI